MKRWILSILVLAVLFSACEKTSSVRSGVHPFNETELHKKSVEASFVTFCNAMQEGGAATDPMADILAHSSVGLAPSGGILYTYRKNDRDLIRLTYSSNGALELSLYGGIGMKGRIDGPLSADWDSWEEKLDVDVYNGDEKVARLGMEVYEYTESGEQVRIPVPVFRFPDGTSYAVSTLLLTEPLLDYLLANVFSTE